MLRAEANAARPSPLGKRARAVMARGGLLPDNLMIRMVKRRLRKERGFGKKSIRAIAIEPDFVEGELVLVHKPFYERGTGAIASRPS